MKLARPAPLSKVVRTICLPDAREDLGERKCIASGWGRYGPSPSLSTALLEASVPLLDLEDCLQAYGTSVPIKNGHLCAGHIDGSSGGCVVIVSFFVTFLSQKQFTVQTRRVKILVCEIFLIQARSVSANRLQNALLSANTFYYLKASICF